MAVGSWTFVSKQGCWRMGGLNRWGIQTAENWGILDRRLHFLSEVTNPVNYERWLRRKAVAHVRRDRKRGNQSATNELYQIAIHSAVVSLKGLDAYTREPLDWYLLSKYDNKASKKGGRKYKAKFYMLPSVDHVGDGTGPADFKICAWRTNDAKNDMSLDQFVDLCRRVVAYNS